MKIRFLKDHLANKKGDTKELETRERADYLIRVGVAEEVKTKRKKKK